MASTNKTTHYNLSQYVSSDKPTYLIDYNSDMSNIDAGIYSAESKATANEGAIGDLTDLNTTSKTDLVTAINEVNTQVGTNKSDISSLNTSVSANTGNIGTMANLDTTSKTDLVTAINEVLSNFNLFNLQYFNTTNYNDLVKVNTSNGNLSITVATNSDGSIAKIYGQGYINIDTVANEVVMSCNSSLRPSSDITINASVVALGDQNGGQGGYIVIRTTGVIEVHIYASADNQNYNILIPPCLYFVKDFGDVQI